MMTDFYPAGDALQIFLLVLSQMTLILLAGSCILTFRYRTVTFRQLGLGVLLLLNIVIYVGMQLANPFAAETEGLARNILYGVLPTVILLSQGYAIRMLLQMAGRHKTINNTSIKEAFDNLPTGICFFNEAGLPVLCNRVMHRFCFAVSDRDIQFVTDLQDCLSEGFVPAAGTVKSGKMFTLPDGTAWSLEMRTITRAHGEVYTQYIAMDITELEKNRIALTEENARLRRVQADLKRLSANVVAITREEEILNTKMRVHDEMGRCLVEAQKYLQEDSGRSIPESVAHSWQRAVSMLKYNTEAPEEDMLAQVRKTCEAVNMRFVQTGTLPAQAQAAYLLTCAIRECVTNAVRYADASELYTAFSETENLAAVVVRNNGRQPESEIVEGGGLSTLRRRVERAGGTMIVQSMPEFKLTVTVPKGKEGVV